MRPFIFAVLALGCGNAMPVDASPLDMSLQDPGDTGTDTIADANVTFDTSSTAVNDVSAPMDAGVAVDIGTDTPSLPDTATATDVDVILPCDGGSYAVCGGVGTCLAIDRANCGTCGTTCPGQNCENGRCVSCPSGMALCTDNGGATGLCTDTNTDNANCGRCGNICLVTRALDGAVLHPTCAEGLCVPM